MKSECMPSGTAWQGSPAEATPALAATNAIREWSRYQTSWLQHGDLRAQVQAQVRSSRRNPILRLMAAEKSTSFHEFDEVEETGVNNQGTHKKFPVIKNPMLSFHASAIAVPLAEELPSVSERDVISRREIGNSEVDIGNEVFLDAFENENDFTFDEQLITEINELYADGSSTGGT